MMIVGKAFGEPYVVTFGRHPTLGYTWACGEDSVLYGCDKQHVEPTLQQCHDAALAHLRLHVGSQNN